MSSCHCLPNENNLLSLYISLSDGCTHCTDAIRRTTCSNNTLNSRRNKTIADKLELDVPQLQHAISSRVISLAAGECIRAKCNVTSLCCELINLKNKNTLLRWHECIHTIIRRGCVVYFAESAQITPQNKLPRHDAP